MSHTTNKEQQPTKQSTEKHSEQDSLESFDVVGREDRSIFQIVKTGKGSFVALGRERLTELMSQEECEQWVDNPNWESWFTTTVAIIHTILQKQNP